MAGFIDFKIKRGSSKEFYTATGAINPLLVIEKGCWYLCTDTAELFLGVLDDTGALALKRINDTDGNYETYIKAIEALNSEITTIKENLTGYAQKTDIPDITNLVTKEALAEAIESVETPEVDLTGYATEQFVKDTITSQVPVEDLAKKAEVAEVKTKLETEIVPTIHDTIIPAIQELSEKAATQEWVQDQGYLTEHQDISGKADINHKHDDLYDAKGAAASIKDELLNGAGAAYDTLKELGDLIADNKDAIEAFEKIAAGKADSDHKHDEYLTEHQSLEEYAKKTEIPDVSKFLSEIPEEYVTEADLDAKGYLTEHQSLDGLATETFVTEKIAEAQLTGSGIDLSDYATKEDLNDFASVEYVNNKLENIEVPDVPTKLSELENDAAFVTANDVDTSIAEQLPEAVTQVIETIILHGGDATPED